MRCLLLLLLLLVASGCAVSDSDGRGAPGSDGDADTGPSDQGLEDRSGVEDASPDIDVEPDDPAVTPDLGEDGAVETGRQDALEDMGVTPDGGPDDVAPRIIRFSANRSEMGPGDSIVFTVLATDDNGIEDLLGGVIEDRAGNEYGLLTTSGSEGSYSFETTWYALQEAESITAPPGGVERVFVARVYDASTLEDTDELSILLTCGTESICDGACFDLGTSSDHCGECGEPLPSGWDVCEQGEPACLTGREYCDSACVDVLSNEDHCGSCEPLPAGWNYCNDGEPACYSGYTFCDTECVDLERDRDYCGSCDHACPVDFFCGDWECRIFITSYDGNTTCDVVCSAAETTCVEAVEFYGLRDSCTCSGVGCYEGPLDCDQTPNSRLDFCEEPGSFQRLRCTCAEP